MSAESNKKITSITIMFDSGSGLKLEGVDARRWMDRHDKAMMLATLAGMEKKNIEMLAKTGTLSADQMTPMKPEVPNWKLNWQAGILEI